MIQKKKLSKEQQRLLTKKREFMKNINITIARKSCMNTLLTMRKDFYGMLKCHINKLVDEYKQNNVELTQQIKEVVKMMPLQHKNVFRRDISKEEHTEDEVIDQIRLIHKYAQSLINKHILTKNKVSNIMNSINHTYNVIFKKIKV